MKRYGTSVAAARRQLQLSTRPPRNGGSDFALDAQRFDGVELVQVGLQLVRSAHPEVVPRGMRRLAFEAVLRQIAGVGRYLPAVGELLTLGARIKAPLTLT